MVSTDGESKVVTRERRKGQVGKRDETNRVNSLITDPLKWTERKYAPNNEMTQRTGFGVPSISKHGGREVKDLILSVYITRYVSKKS